MTVLLSSCANFSKITYSTWFKLLPQGGYVSPMFIYTYKTAEYYTSGISLNRTTGMALVAWARDDTPDGKPYAEWDTAESFSLSDGWHHLCWSCDMSLAGSGAKKATIYVDDVARMTNASPTDEPWFTPAFNTAGDVLAFPHYAPSGNYSSGASHRAWGDTQIWIGSCFDLSSATVRANFYTITGGRGYPTNTAVAEANLGKPTFRFTGNASRFPFNTGTGNSMTKIGTCSDYTPTPSFG